MEKVIAWAVLSNLGVRQYVSISKHIAEEVRRARNQNVPRSAPHRVVALVIRKVPTL